ncbi:MAG: phage Gp37/Gp68 family protein [Phycisphaerae bacterium]
MGLNSTIEWTEATWNPVTGCTKVSAGCQNCYAERMARRLQAMGNPNYKRGFKVTTHPKSLYLPLAWKQPRIVFVNSMSDLFHEQVPLPFIEKVFDVMHRADWHQYQVLTKRSERLLQLDTELRWAPHIWMGVTVENADCTFRIDHLRKIRVPIKFVSLEPLLGPIPNLNLTGIDWVIVGGESGPGARPMRQEWVAEIQDRCREAGVPFFFKQWGGVHKKKAGRVLDGRTWDEMPEGALPLFAAEKV